MISIIESIALLTIRSLDELSSESYIFRAQYTNLRHVVLMFTKNQNLLSKRALANSSQAQSFLPCLDNGIEL